MKDEKIRIRKTELGKKRIPGDFGNSRLGGGTIVPGQRPRSEVINERGEN